MGVKWIFDSFYGWNMVIDYQLVRGAKWYIRFLYKIKMNDKNKEKSKKRVMPRRGGVMMVFLRCSQKNPSSKQ